LTAAAQPRKALGPAVLAFRWIAVGKPLVVAFWTRGYLDGRLGNDLLDGEGGQDQVWVVAKDGGQQHGPYENK
jgi:hypothetical protein